MRTVRVLPPLLADGFGRPTWLLKGLMYGFAGSAASAMLAAAIAWGQGADVRRLDEVHQFYILVVPFLAGFGWGAPPPRRRSRIFAASSLVVAVLLVFAAVPFPFEEQARVECYFPYETPRHVAHGFEFEPWRWRSYHWLGWFAAPAGLAELTLRHITQPLTGLACTDTGDLPRELL